MVWISVETPAVQLRRIDRDAGTQGTVYCAWPLTKSFCVVSQSLPQMRSWLNAQSSVPFCLTSLYKVCRRQQRQHLGWCVERHNELERLNMRLSTFSRLVFLTNRPDNWHLTPGRCERCPPPAPRSHSAPAGGILSAQEL